MPSSKKESGSNRKTVAIGRHYEEQAARFFVQQGYEILERNWRAGRKEIDLIVSKGNLVAFVEVKGAASQQFGHPSEKVDQRKQAHLTEAAQQYVDQKELTAVDLRFDVVTFTGGEMEHYPAAFEATESR